MVGVGDGFYGWFGDHVEEEDHAFADREEDAERVGTSR